MRHRCAGAAAVVGVCRAHRVGLCLYRRLRRLRSPRWAALRETGIEVAIDDFGTGYSSLAYLKHLPADVIKIDQAFVAGLGTDRADSLLVEAIIKVAHSLELFVVAEGVETVPQLATLRDLGCDAAQGYLLARPVRAGDLPAAVELAHESVARLGGRRDL
ncbi:MAG: EAL domain-containing protein [Acidimicrobiales bacterium]